ncbi:MAG: non-homologous end-joining DNA ligase [Acidimicrobiales bacterium]
MNSGVGAGDSLEQVPEVADRALSDYRGKRDFAATPEPAGSTEQPGRGEGGQGNRWVVQQHAARRLHYDFRLEANGVLVSWAVPKGPSYDPGVKRLAVKVEDHPLDYRDFEGTIPGGNYGAGAVIVWDEGTYRNLTTRHGELVPVAEAVGAGHVSVWLEGSKLVGGWALTRFDGANWALVKRSDDHAAPQREVTSEEPRSVKTGRTLDEVRDGGARSDRDGSSGPAPATFCPPMLAQLEAVSPEAASGPLAGKPGEWIFEPKLDGLRCTAVRNGPEVTLFSRNRLSFNARFPSVVKALGQLAATNFVIDGELVGMIQGRPDFGALQQGAAQVQLWAFDLPWLLGRDLRHLPLEDRKALLDKTVTEGADLRVVRALLGDPRLLFERACQDRWEGLVAKRSGSRYVPGRSSDWRKLKCGYRQELVVGGFTAPRGTRQGFGALLVGYWDAGELVYAGKVGTGFDRSELAQLLRRLEGAERRTSPFRPGTKTDVARWVSPELVVEVEFSNWTTDGRLRHPRFLGVRADKPSKEVVRESAPGQGADEPRNG